MQVLAGYFDSMAFTLSDSEMDAWQALLHAHHKITSMLDAELRESHQLTWAEYDVLLRLAKATGRTLTMPELARRIMIPPRGLTRLAARPEERGFVKRARSNAAARVDTPS